MTEVTIKVKPIPKKLNISFTPPDDKKKQKKKTT